MLPIQVKLEGVQLGVVEAEPVRVEPSAEALRQEFFHFCDRLARRWTHEHVTAWEPVRQVRAMFHAWGVDPTKYRPAAEALLRRLVQGKGLRSISNVVDVVNWGSLETGWPYGCYDRDRVEPPVEFRHGQRGEVYEGIGRRVWHLEGRPVLADRRGPFGSPISDSTRTEVTPATRALLVTIFAPSLAGGEALTAALERLAERLKQWAGAERVALARVVV